MRQKYFSIVLSLMHSLSMTVPAFAAEQPSEIESAGAFLYERGIYQGDDSGGLMLDKGLTRAEMAAILTRIHGGGEAAPNNYTWACPFTDVPEWARSYVGYCTANRLVAGYDITRYGPDDTVTPAMACTVILRCCGYYSGENSEWSYNTACDYAVSMGLLSWAATRKASISRGEMAVLICRAMTSDYSAVVSVPQKPEGCYLVNGEPLTEGNVLELLLQIEKDWPRGTTWDEKTKNEVPSTEANRIIDNYPVNHSYGCGGYAAMVSSLLFGDTANPGHKLDDPSQLRPGDILFRVNNETGKIWHVAIALESPNSTNAFHITDGNWGGAVHWPDRQAPYGRDNLDFYRGDHAKYHLEVWSRYPEDAPYTGESVGAWPTGMGN